MTGDISSRALVGGEYHYYMNGEYQKTGGTCSTGETASSSTTDVPDDTCPAGWVSLYSNGQNICYDPNTGAENDPHPDPVPTAPKTSTKDTTTTDNGDGTITTTTTETGSDGSTTTTTRTCDAAGNCSETTTTTAGTGGGSGSGSGEDQSDDPLEDFCKDNAASAICKKEPERKWSGDCSAYQCEGDPIDCAVAKTLHEQRCAMKWAEEANPLSEIYNETLAAVPGQGVIDAAMNKSGDLDIDLGQKFEEARQDYVTFTSECMPPPYFEFKGTTYTFNTEFLCQIADYIRLMVHLIAYMIVLRGFMKLD
ncbi:virulence factor TspB C-terminal domain-related protein [Azoarcus sp. DD4]|uniref:virulence factor TspB C-terminal domain-related protein n=1 Tax=Azoarcus sp. DD4 TaxID=2027405 RepID=UPI00112C13A2|nr:virulence factor TspB C-terminal domain-related protein [Azoarcus sp. DD4]